MFKNRYQPKIEWSSKSWTHNVFRFWELLFGRKIGIRAESSTAIENGIVTRQFHSWESVFAFGETVIREKLFFKLKVVKIYLPVLVTPEQQMFLPSMTPYLFAIALDTTTDGGNDVASSDSFSHTCTGTDRLLWGSMSKESAGTVSSMTYNSVGLTSAVSRTYTARSEYATLWYLAAPATGANTFAGNYSASLNGRLVAMSYTGCKQTGIPDATASAESATSPLSVNITTVANNSWVAFSAYSQRLITASTNSTVRQGSSTQCAAGDNNGAVTPAGSYTMTLQYSGATAGNVTVLASFAPATGNTSNFLTFM
jgi:hypothetical protein